MIKRIDKINKLCSVLRDETHYGKPELQQDKKVMFKQS